MGTLASSVRAHLGGPRQLGQSVTPAQGGCFLISQRLMILGCEGTQPSAWAKTVAPPMGMDDLGPSPH